MDLDELRSILRKSGVDVWTFIDTAISVASSDYREELKDRRDGIVEKLYVPAVSSCRNCHHESPRNGNEIKEKDSSSHEGKGGGSPSTPQSIDGGDFRERSFGRSIDEEQTKILAIKERLEEPDQSEDFLVNLLQNLADMDITFKALKETDIGRHVNHFRKNPSSEVRRLVKQLVRKWKYLVDEWVNSNQTGETAASTLIDGDSPQQNQPKSNQNVNHHQIPDFAYSPNPHNGSSGSDKYNSEPERKVKVAPPRRDPPLKPSPPVSSSSSALNKQREQKDSLIDPERLASARRRLHENYQEAQNAKKQRTVQVMDINDLPKPKNSYSAKNKSGFQSKHW